MKSFILFANLQMHLKCTENIGKWKILLCFIPQVDDDSVLDVIDRACPGVVESFINQLPPAEKVSVHNHFIFGPEFAGNLQQQQEQGQLQC